MCNIDAAGTAGTATAVSIDAETIFYRDSSPRLSFFSIHSRDLWAIKPPLKLNDDYVLC